LPFRNGPSRPPGCAVGAPGSPAPAEAGGRLCTGPFPGNAITASGGAKGAGAEIWVICDPGLLKVSHCSLHQDAPPTPHKPPRGGPTPATGRPLRAPHTQASTAPRGVHQRRGQLPGRSRNGTTDEHGCRLNPQCLSTDPTPARRTPSVFIRGSIPCETAGTRALGRPQASKAPTRRKHEGGTEHAETRAGSAVVPRANLTRVQPAPRPHAPRPSSADAVLGRTGVAQSGVIHTALRARRQSFPLGGRCLSLNVRNGWRLCKNVEP
jgi:hypothetical protein